MIHGVSSWSVGAGANEAGVKLQIIYIFRQLFIGGFGSNQIAPLIFNILEMLDSH